MLSRDSQSSTRLHRHFLCFIILLFFGWLIASLFFGERIPESNGIGWDGVTYAALLKDYPNMVFHSGLSLYTLQRIVPSGVIYYFLKLFHLSATDANIPLLFSLYNTVLLGFAVFLWQRLASKRQWQPNVQLLSFAGLFLNYAILKMNTYDPVLTDTTAFVLGLMMIYSVLLHKPLLLLLTTLIGAFTFPTLLFVGLLLFIFNTGNRVTTDKTTATFSPSSGLLALLSAIALVILLYFIYFIAFPKEEMALSRNPKWLFLSLTALFIYFFAALMPVFSSCKQICVRIINAANLTRIISALVIFLAVKYCLHFFSNGEVGALTPWRFLELIAVRSLAYPGIFLVSHVIYFGPLICLFIYFWREIIAYLTKTQPALLVVTLCYIFIAIDSESRQIINFMPLAIVVLAEILNQKKIPWVTAYGLVALSILISKVWLPLNHHAWISLSTHPPQASLHFPLQWYFMSQAPWMSQTFFIVNGIVVILTFLLLYPLKRNLR